MNRTEQLVNLIRNTKTRQAHLFLPYALAILYNTTDRSIDFETINKAIITRWSENGLVNIKDGAWGILQYIEHHTSGINDGMINNLWIRS